MCTSAAWPTAVGDIVSGAHGWSRRQSRSCPLSCRGSSSSQRLCSSLYTRDAPITRCAHTPAMTCCTAYKLGPPVMQQKKKHGRCSVAALKVRVFRYSGNVALSCHALRGWVSRRLEQEQSVHESPAVDLI